MDPKTNLIITLKELEDCIEKGDEEKLKENIERFNQDLKLNKQELDELYTSGNQRATQTALILAACRSNQADILYFLLYETDILDHFPGTDFANEDVKTQRTEAFKFALEGDAFPIVELLYDYWSGDLHWDGHDLSKLTTLGKMLEEAREVCEVANQQLTIDIHSLIAFNTFQQALYSSISQIQEPADMLLEVLRFYDEYSDIDKVRIPHVLEETERELRIDLEDKISDFMRMQAYIKYGVYFRKLDFNVALLVLDNWFILRKQFKDRFNQPKKYFKNNPTVKSSYEKAVSLYKEIECSLYHFIYRTWEDWRLYLPRNRQITVEDHHTGIHEGKIIQNLKIKYDVHTYHNGPVLFLERKNFSERVKEFKTLLKDHIISPDPVKSREHYSKITEAEQIDILLHEDYLTPTDNHTLTNTNMRDFYSLSKIVYYIEAIENTDDDDIDVLMIERVLQVTGEMSKSSDDTNHLSESAKSLLQIAISVDTVKHLSNIRLFLSHANKGQLSTRDSITNSDKDIFKGIKQDLININKKIASVLDIYKKILDKSLLEKGLTLLDEQIANLLNKSLQNIDEMISRSAVNSEQSETLIPTLDDVGLKTQLYKEIIMIRSNRLSISDKINLSKISISDKIVSILPTFIQNIRQVLSAIEKNNDNVQFIKKELEKCKIKKEMPDNPNKDAVEKMKRTIRTMKENNKNANIDYDSILVTLNGIKDFGEHWKAIRNMLSFCYDECKQLGPKPEVQNNVSSVTKILNELDGKCTLVKNGDENHTFDAIEKLNDILVKPGTTMDQLKSFLISRVNHLKDILKCSQNIPWKVNLDNYKKDRKFRLQLEMVLADIGNLFDACKQGGCMNKPNMLLKEIDLGNVLDHGNPFLDVIAEVFDPYDPSNGLLEIAEMLAARGESMIQALP